MLFFGVAARAGLGVRASDDLSSNKCSSAPFSWLLLGI